MLIDTPTNEVIVSSLEVAGVSAPTINVYVNEMPLAQDNLEVLASYWVQKITSKQIHTRQVADVCLYLMDTQSKYLWLNCFTEYVIPIIIAHRIME